MRYRLTLAFLVLLVAWLLLRPHGLTPSAELPTFAAVRNNAGGIYPATFQARQRAEGNCSYPPLPDGARLVLLSAMRGQGVSMAAIGSQQVAVTTAALTIAPGDDPLYVVLVAGRATLWRLDGASGRVRNLVLVGGGSDTENGIPLGVTGLARDKVTFRPSSCLRAFIDKDAADAAQAAAALKDGLGRRPDVISAGDAVSRFDIPAGRTSVSDPSTLAWRLRHRPLSVFEYFGFDFQARLRPGLDRQMEERYPDGVIAIDPAAVIAGAPVSSYDVLPDLAGLQQLIHDGAVADMGWGEFHILRKIQLPAELSTGSFLLLKGVPRPDGDSGQACVVSQETGRVLALSRHPALC